MFCLLCAVSHVVIDLLVVMQSDGEVVDNLWKVDVLIMCCAGFVIKLRDFEVYERDL